MFGIRVFYNIYNSVISEFDYLSDGRHEITVSGHEDDPEDQRWLRFLKPTERNYRILERYFNERIQHDYPGYKIVVTQANTNHTDFLVTVCIEKTYIQAKL